MNKVGPYILSSTLYRDVPGGEGLWTCCWYDVVQSVCPASPMLFCCEVVEDWFRVVDGDAVTDSVYDARHSSTRTWKFIRLYRYRLIKYVKLLIKVGLRWDKVLASLRSLAVTVCQTGFCVNMQRCYVTRSVLYSPPASSKDIIHLYGKWPMSSEYQKSTHLHQ